MEQAELEIIDETERIRNYRRMQAELREERGMVGNIGMLRHVPYPMQVLSVVLILGLAVVFLKYIPAGLDWFMEEYTIEGASKRNLFVGSIIINLFLFGVLGVILFFTGGVTLPWLKAGLMRKPVGFNFTENKILNFRIPKRVLSYMWDLDGKEDTVEPTAMGVFNGPNKISVMCMTPGHYKGLDILGLVKGVKNNWNMARVHLYGKQKAQEARDSMKPNTSDLFFKMMPYIIVLLIVGGLLWPTVDKKLDQSNRISSLENRLVQYRMYMVDNGITPPDTEKIAAPVEADGNPPASTGGGVTRKDEIEDRFKVV